MISIKLVRPSTGNMDDKLKTSVVNTFSFFFAAKYRGCRSQRAKRRPETGDLGDRCQCRDLQGEVSGMKSNISAISRYSPFLVQ